MKKQLGGKKSQSTLMLVATICSIFLVASFGTNAFAELEKNQNIQSTKIQYLIKTTADSYYVKFQTCVGKDPVQTPIFVIESDKEYKIVKYSKIIMPNTCKTFETLIKSKYLNTIEVTLINI